MLFVHNAGWWQCVEEGDDPSSFYLFFRLWYIPDSLCLLCEILRSTWRVIYLVLFTGGGHSTEHAGNKSHPNPYSAGTDLAVRIHEWMRLWYTFVHMLAKLMGIYNYRLEHILRMVRSFRRHCPPDSLLRGRGLIYLLYEKNSTWRWLRAIPTPRSEKCP